MTVKRGAGVRLTLASIAVPYAEPPRGPPANVGHAALARGASPYADPLARQSSRECVSVYSSPSVSVRDILAMPLAEHSALSAVHPVVQVIDAPLPFKYPGAL